MERNINGYRVIAHKPYSDGVVVLVGQNRYDNTYEYVVATMADLKDSSWFSGHYTNNIDNAVARYANYA